MTKVVIHHAEMSLTPNRLWTFRITGDLPIYLRNARKRGEDLIGVNSVQAVRSCGGKARGTCSACTLPMLGARFTPPKGFHNDFLGIRHDGKFMIDWKSGERARQPISIMNRVYDSESVIDNGCVWISLDNYRRATDAFTNKSMSRFSIPVSSMSAASIFAEADGLGTIQPASFVRVPRTVRLILSGDVSLGMLHNSMRSTLATLYECTNQDS
ncbi:uncharacterized protein EV420DRAFT_1486054 [Desarmillaria tabescens]|uniref:Uncharacterized protein n=1 Tax=Armillaria tabescens TaxID=1929756 RepID=A0AA39JC53_ARMTA|nr:uncharacterized protein EV420DRAFT_1486054 [Desarmillaria tabescens]KAK0440032.1 hypothetical protein EV420DRAFT_1486054 [Desarmillaria tabescens]